VGRRSRFNPRKHNHQDRYFNEHFGPGGRPKKAFDFYEAAQRDLECHDLGGSVYQCNVCQKYHVGHRDKKTGT
jgi:hypothetical protein